jgi:hypothetical protein
MAGETLQKPAAAIVWQYADQFRAEAVSHAGLRLSSPRDSRRFCHPSPVSGEKQMVPGDAPHTVRQSCCTKHTLR